MKQLYNFLCTGVGKRLRERRFQFLFPLVEKIFQQKNKVSIIDLGGTHKYWELFPKECLLRWHVHITIVNLPSVNPPFETHFFSTKDGDCCDLQDIADKQFDLSYSNSVIEHVGDWEKMQQFSHEVRRVSKYYFVQTPNASFPIEPHFMFPFFHKLPISLRVFLLHHFNLGAFTKKKTLEAAYHSIGSVNLLDKNKLQQLFPGGSIENEYCFGLSKSLIAVSKS